MKRKLFLPALAIVLAVGGAFASSKLAPVYYASTDFTCSTPLMDQNHCAPGDDEICEENGQTFRYSDPANNVTCDQLLKDIQ